MRPVTILIEKCNNYALSISEIKYTFRTLLTIAGLSLRFIENDTEKDLDIYFGRTAHKSKIFINMADIERKNITTPVKIMEEGGKKFLLFTDTQRDKEIFLEKYGCVQIWNDIVLASFYLLSGWQEKKIRLEKWDKYRIRESFLYQNKLLWYPLVNNYALLFQKIFSQTQTPLSLWPDNKKYAVALSHDVDYPEMIHWIEAIRYAAGHWNRVSIKKISDIIQGKESFWRFSDWMSLEKQYGLKSSFYFSGFQGSLLRYFFKSPDPFYNIQKQNFRDVMRFIDDNSFEIGMQSSYTAYQSEERFKAEKMAVEAVLGKPIFGNRHHYWHMDPRDPVQTAYIHKRIGLLYDSSLIFDQHPGFRRGICSPFYLFNQTEGEKVGVLQVPPVLMDNQLFGYTPYTKLRSYKDAIDMLLTVVRAVGGVLVVDYHVRVFNETFFPYWRESYRYLLESIIKERDFYCDTLINIVRYWREREQKLIAEGM